MMILDLLSDIASIVTALAAGGAWAYYLWTRRSKRERLETYLLAAKQSARGDEKGQKTIIHLMAKCGLTEAEILDAAFRSDLIKTPVWANEETGRAEGILLEYNPPENSKRS